MLDPDIVPRPMSLYRLLKHFGGFRQLVLLGLVALVAARPDSVINLDLDDIHHDLDIDDAETFTGTYR